MTELISRQRSKFTPEVARDVFDHMSERAHSAFSGWEASWDHIPPRVAQYT